MLYPAELRGQRGFPRVSRLGSQALRGTERKQAAQRGTLESQFRAHGRAI